MIIYHCDKCNIDCETSTCPICNNRAYLKTSKIFYCSHCNAPSFNEICNCCHNICEVVGTDLRPVFAEERLLIEILLNEPFKFANCSVYNVGGSKYLVDGKKLNLSYANLRKNNDASEVSRLLLKYSHDNQKNFNNLNEKVFYNFIKCNKDRLNFITYEAKEYIKKVASEYDLNTMFVSFSGGKDSTVVSSLVTDTLGDNIIHIYGDTTLEYPTSEEYVKRFRTKYYKTPLLSAKNKDQDFNDLCNVIGPPSRMMRWCCTVFKTGAITKKIDSTFKNAKKILTFQGIRRNESSSRNKYERDSNESKIVKQISCNPIIDWLDFDVWLYILSNHIDFNDAYRLGFSRVGCWCCPNNSEWSEFLASIYMADKFNLFRDILYNFAKKVGKPDYKEYIDRGQWKKRQGGNGLEIAKNTVVSYKPCALEENTYYFTLTKPLTERFYTYFKPFGKLNFTIGNKLLNEIYILDRKTNMPLLKIKGHLGQNEIRITVIDQKRYKDKIEIYLKNQINKYQTCLGCTYCEAVCKFDALKVMNLKKGSVSADTIYYEIDETKCVGCLECVTHFQNGCYLCKVLRTKKG